MNIQKIIESLLRARLYGLRARLRLRSGATHVLAVREVRYDGSRSEILVSRPGSGRRSFAIPLREVVTATCEETGPDAA